VSICSSCGKEINEDSAFCQFCGHNKTPWLEKGTILYHGRYKIIDSIGSGGMAKIYLTEDLNLENMPCVIKAMSDDFKEPEEREYAIKKFKEEAVMLAKLRHNSLPVVQNHFVEEGRYYLVMDYVEGKTLEDILDDTLLEKKFLPEERVVEWGIQICDILDYLHNHEPMIIHRDLKPENLIETKDGRIMLIDFGIAHIFEKRDTKTRIGTTGFAAPEQYMGNAYPQSDIFSLGAVIHILLTGEDPMEREGNPFRFPLLKEFRDDLSPEIQDVLLKSQHMEVEKRYASAKEFQMELFKIKEKLKSPSRKIKTSFLTDIFRFEEGLFSELQESLKKKVSIDAGSHEVKLLQLAANKKGHIYPRLVVTKKNTPHAVSKGIIADPTLMSKTFKALTKNMEDLDFIFSISPYASNIRTVKIPPVGPGEVPSVLSSKLEEIILLPVKECHIKYDILPSGPEEDKEFMKVRITAVMKRAYESLQKTIITSGLNYDRIVLYPFSVALTAFFMMKDGVKKDNVAIIDIGSEGTTVTCIKDKILSQSLYFPFGSVKFEDKIVKEGDILPAVREWTGEFLKILKDFGPDYSINSFDSVIFCGGAIQIEGLQECINKEFGIISDKFFLPGINNIKKEEHKNFMFEKGPLLMPCAGLIISSLKELTSGEEVSKLITFDLFYNPLTREIEIPSGEPLTGKRAIEELEKYMIATVGSVGKTVLEDSIKKLGHRKENFPLESLDGLIEVFTCQVNLKEKDLPGIIKKLEELKSAKYIEKTSPHELFIDYDINIPEELEKYLVSIVGPVGKTVLEDTVKKLGHTKESLPLNMLDSVIEVFSCQFNLSENDISNISKKMDEFKVIAEKIRKKSEALENINIFEELEKYIVSIVGPVGKIVLEDTVKKLGHTKETFPVNMLDSVVEVFSCQFNLSEGDISNINKKLDELKIIAEKKKNIKPDEEGGQKAKKKGLFSSIFKWGT